MFLSCESRDRRANDDDDELRQRIKRARLEDCKLNQLNTDDCPAIYNLPPPGSPVERRKIRKAGNYLIGPEIVGHRPVRSIVQYLARKENTDEFYQLKILLLSTRRNETNDDFQGKALIHTEYSLLSLLENDEGIVKQHGLFTDLAYEEEMSSAGIPEYTGELRKRIILVLDCPIHHPYCNKSSSFISLQEYIMQHKRLSECEALSIFYDTVVIVENMHKKNVIHRDLKLGNIILNKCSRKVTLINFGLGKYLANEETLLHDQKGSPAYISPDVVCGRPYKGKPSDMWALGVVFYIMIYGNFPFFKPNSTALFEQILAGEYETPKNFTVSPGVNEIIKGLLNTNAEARLTASSLRQKLEYLLFQKRPITLDQRVPSLTEVPKCRNMQTVPVFGAKHDQIVPKSLEKWEDGFLMRLFGDGDGVVPMLITSPRELPQRGSRVFQGLDGTENEVSEIAPLMTAMHDQFVNYAATLSRTINNGSDRLVYHPARSSALQTADSLVRNFICKLDHHFISGQILPPRDRPLQEFHGILTFEFANNLQRWLLEKFCDDPFVHDCLINSDENAVSKIKNFLGRCGVQIEISICGPRICRKQTVHTLLLLTYMLQVSGYKNTYFITQLSSNR